MGKPRTKRVKAEEDQQQREQLLAHLWTQGADLHEIARAMDLSLTKLSELASDRMFRLTLRRLCALGNMRSRLITSRYRVHAAAKLVALASDGEDEIARKASVDLLKMGLESHVRARPRPRKVDAPADEANDAGDLLPGAGVGTLPGVLEELRKLGEERDE